jgi:hypothetical protein
MLLFGAALVAGAPRAAEAVTITLVSFGASNVSVGSTVSVQISISGLGSGAAPALGAWDIDVAFDPTVISLSGVTFRSPSELGPGSLQDSGLIPIGPTESRVDAAEISFEDAAALEAAQPDAFLLATIQFTGLTTGMATFSFAQLLLSDAQGAPLPADSVVEAPEPTGFALAGLGAAALLLRARRRAA